MAERAYLDINGVASVDMSNYLLIDFRSLLKEPRFSNLTSSVDELWRTGRAINSALEDGFTPDRIANIQSFYFEVVKWLKGQEQTNNWIALPPLKADSSSLDSDISNFTNSWMVNYLNTFFANAILTNYYFDNVRARSRRESIEFKRVLADYTATSQVELKKTLKNAEDELEKTHKRMMSDYRASVALHDWQTYYGVLVEPSDVQTKSKGKFKKTKNIFNGIFKPNSQSYYDEMVHNKLWKNIWLSLFVIFFLISIWFSHYMKWTIKDNAAEILTIKIGISILFGTLYVSANKNYRIYANLFDQTKFRSVVSKTIQGIILDERLAEEDRRILLTVAAQSLFEMKVSGHLTKKDSGTPANDLLLSILSRKD